LALELGLRDPPLSEWRRSTLFTFEGCLDESWLLIESLLLLLVDDRLSTFDLIEDRPLRFKALWSFFVKFSSTVSKFKLWLSFRDPDDGFFFVADFLMSGATAD
jgi:hypothetical protein